MVTIFFYQENNSEYVNIKFQKLKALKVASDVSTIHPTSRRNNGLVSETRLSTPFNKILATPLKNPVTTSIIMISLNAAVNYLWYQYCLASVDYK